MSFDPAQISSVIDQYTTDVPQSPSAATTIATEGELRRRKVIRIILVLGLLALMTVLIINAIKK